MTTPQITREDLERARARLGLTGGVQVAQRPTVRGFTSMPEEQEGTRFGFIPGPVRDALGFLERVDRPLSERVGFRIPDAPGPFDEILNAVIEEGTRPSTLGIALFGAGIGAKAATSTNRAIRLAGALAEPIGGTTFGTRAASEALFGAGVRGAGALVNEQTEGLPTPIRAALTLAGGVAGGAATFSATRGAIRSAIGRDVLTPPVHSTGLRLRPGVKGDDFVGNIFKLPTTAQIENQGVSGVINGLKWGERLRAGINDAAEAQFASRIRRLGPIAVDSKTGAQVFTGIKRVKGDDPAFVQTVLEFPSRFVLSREQREAVEQVGNLYQVIRAEGDVHGIERELTNLAEGQQFIHRALPVEDRGRVISSRVQTSLSDYTREYMDPDTAIRAGQKYGDPNVAFREYADRTLGTVLEKHFDDMLIERWGERWTDRLDAGPRAKLDKTLANIRATRNQLLSADVRGTTLQRVYDRISKLSASEGRRAGRVEARIDDLLARQGDLELKDVVQASRDVNSAVTDGRNLVREIQENADLLKQAKATLTSKERAILKQANDLDALLLEIEGVRSGGDAVRDAIERIAADTLPLDELPAEARLRFEGQQSLDREWARLVREADRVEARMTRLTEEAADMTARVDDLLEKKAIFQDLRAKGDEDYLVARRNERAARESNAALRAATRELNALEGIQMRLLREAERTKDDQLKQIIKQAQGEEKLKALKENAAAQRRDVERAIREAKATRPAGRTTFNGGEYYRLRGVDFPEEIVKEVEEYYKRRTPVMGQLGKGINSVKAMNKALTPFRAALDFSVTLNQLLPFAAGNPRQFWRNLRDSLADAGRPLRYDEWLASPEVFDAAQSGVAIMGRGTNPLTDFEFDNWLEQVGRGSVSDVALRLPGKEGSIARNPVLWPLGEAFRRTQIQFQSMSTRMRVSVFNSQVGAQAAMGLPLGVADKMALARGLNMLSGVATSSAGNIESLAEFAPNFLWSNIELVVAAGMSGAIEGQVARQYLRNWLALATFTTAGVATLQGRDLHDVLLPLSENGLEKGELRLNPNFLTIRVGGQDVSLLGRLSSLGALALLGGDAAVGVVSERSLSPIKDAVEQFFRTKGSPAVAAAMNLYTGHTFFGESITDPSVFAGELIPFTFSGFLEDYRAGMPVADIALGGLANALGAKANPITAFEQVDEAARRMFGVEYSALTGQQRQQLEQALPQTFKRFERQDEEGERTGNAEARARNEYRRIDQTRLAEEQNLTAALQAHEIDADTWRERLRDLQRESALQKRAIAQTLGVEYADPRNPARQALTAWYDLYDQAKIPGTEVINWDIHDSLEQDLFARIQAGEYGDPAAAMAQINDRSKPEHQDPLVQAFFDAREYVNASPYWALTNEAFTRFADLASRIAGRPIRTYNELVNAISGAELDGDRILERRLKAVQSRVDDLVRPQRDRLRLQDQQLDQSLAIGYGYVPIRQRRR